MYEQPMYLIMQAAERTYECTHCVTAHHRHVQCAHIYHTTCTCIGHSYHHQIAPPTYTRRYMHTSVMVISEYIIVARAIRGRPCSIICIRSLSWLPSSKRLQAMLAKNMDIGSGTQKGKTLNSFALAEV